MNQSAMKVRNRDELRQFDPYFWQRIMVLKKAQIDQSFPSVFKFNFSKAMQATIQDENVVCNLVGNLQICQINIIISQQYEAHEYQHICNYIHTWVL